MICQQWIRSSRLIYLDGEIGCLIDGLDLIRGGGSIRGYRQSGKGRTTSQLPDPTLEFSKSLIRPADFGSLERKPQEFCFIGRTNPAFLLVDGQLEPALQEPTDALGYPFPGPKTFPENEEVIGVPDES
jgi:hypothetical protein